MIKTIIILIGCALFVGTFAGVLILNIAGIPGALISGFSEKRSKVQLIAGIVISSIGQSYVYLAYMAFVISLANVNANFSGFSKYLLWFFVFMATVAPLATISNNASRENIEFRDGMNVQVIALNITFLIAFIMFFVFAFAPSTMSILWSWLPNVD